MANIWYCYFSICGLGIEKRGERDDGAYCLEDGGRGLGSSLHDLVYDG